MSSVLAPLTWTGMRHVSETETAESIQVSQSRAMDIGSGCEGVRSSAQLKIARSVSHRRRRFNEQSTPLLSEALNHRMIVALLQWVRTLFSLRHAPRVVSLQ